MLEIDGKLINLKNFMFACPDGETTTKLVFVDGRAITVYASYEVVKMAILKFGN